jgi:hypothetical protein
MATLRTQYKNYLFVNQDSKISFEEWEQKVFTPKLKNAKEQIMERDTSWDDPQLSDGDMPIRQQNALKNTFPDLEIQKEVEPQSQLEELNDYLKMLADMDKIGIRRKIVLLEGYIHKLKNNIK